LTARLTGPARTGHARTHPYQRRGGPQANPQATRLPQGPRRQRGQSFSYPATAAEASREIERLLGAPRTSPADARRERRHIADHKATRRGDAAHVRHSEITGYGSSARWARAEDER
jgi:hypothetical protein